MAAVVASRPTDVPSRTPTPPPSLSLNTTSTGSPAPIPNKHIPYCSPGPTPFGLPSPPASPPSKRTSLTSYSLLYPPDPNSRTPSNSAVYAINAATLALALERQATRPLAKAHELFPWLHGLHPQNALQQAFFTSRNSRRASRREACRPPPNQRFITLVKAGGDLASSRLKGALAPDEVLAPLGSGTDLAPCFLDIDPRCGFSVRNFQIQACKIATISDIVVYGDETTPREELEKLVDLLAQAQANLREEITGNTVQTCDDAEQQGMEEYNTFLVADPFSAFEQYHPDIVAMDSSGAQTGAVLDFLTQERAEMMALSAPSAISHNVFLGSTPEPTMYNSNTPNQEMPADDQDYSILIEASDMACMPEQEGLDEISTFLHEKDRRGERAVAHLEVPSSGSFLVGERGDVCGRTLDSLIRLCKWMWDMTHPCRNSSAPLTDSLSMDSEGDTDMRDTSNGVSPMFSSTAPICHRLLLHCADGYTETTLLALAYYMFSYGVPLHTAIVDLHVQENRNCFAYPTDKHFLQAIEDKLLQFSPVRTDTTILPQLKRRVSAKSIGQHPEWLSRMDGSLPSRILPHLYLGNLAHATNPALLKSLGITRILSVGEPCTFAPDSPYANDFEFCRIGNVQDNGVDALRPNFDESLSFIEEAENEVRGSNGERGKVLVHCRVGVSRSATVVIAYVMKRLSLGFARAYCFVRARRLNVIVQPHLRFVYELLGWEEELGHGLQRRNSQSSGSENGLEMVDSAISMDEGENQHLGKKDWNGRELEWATISREIAAMNRPYCRQ